MNSSNSRNFEIVQWLENKFGSSADRWNVKGLASQLSKEKLEAIPGCFIDLQSNVKLKLLLSMMYIPRRTLEQCSNLWEDITNIACQDTDEWVQTVADLLKDYPCTSAFSFNTEQKNGPYESTCEQLSELLKKDVSKRSTVFPYETEFLNRNALNALYDTIPQPEKHFALKRKPKSAAIRAELIEKCKFE